MFKGLLTISLLLLTFSFAQADSTYSISQIVLIHHRAVVKASDLRAGDVLLATLNGQQCPLNVLSTNENIVTVDTSGCAFENTLKLGQSLERSLISEPNAAATTVPAETAVASAPSINSAIKLEKAETTSAQCARNMTSIINMPCEGHAFVTSIYSNENYESENPETRTEIETKSLWLDVEYGLRRNWSLAIRDSLTLSEETEKFDKFSENTRNTKADGFSNPWLETNFKLSDQTTGDSADLGISFKYSPNLVTAKSGSATSKGTMGTGGDRIAIGALIAKKVGRSEFGTGLNYTAMGDRSWDDGSGYKETGGNILAISLADRINFASDWYGGISLARRHVESANGKDSFGTAYKGSYNTTVLDLGLSKFDPASSMKFFASGEYMFIEDRKVLDYKVTNSQQITLEAGVSVAL